MSRCGGRCARPRDEAAIADRHTARADASRCFVGDCLAVKGLGVGTEMPLDGDGTMVGDKITIALAP
jgi:hypothetical protein